MVLAFYNTLEREPPPTPLCPRSGHLGQGGQWDFPCVSQDLALLEGQGLRAGLRSSSALPLPSLPPPHCAVLVGLSGILSVGAAVHSRAAG